MARLRADGSVNAVGAVYSFEHVLLVACAVSGFAGDLVTRSHGWLRAHDVG